MKLSVHPVAEIFPMMGKVALRELSEDIAENGLQQAITIQGGVLLDGRNRLAACEVAGVNPEYREYEGGDVVAFIIGANLHRRHLTESQRGMVAARLAKMPRGGDRPSKKDSNFEAPNSANGNVSQKQAATLLDVGVSLVKDAKIIERESPELAAAVMSGEMTIHAAKETLRPHVANNSGDNEWYTPKPYVEAARAVMGKIDLDPASSEEANKVVEASEIFTEKENGLKQDWAGKCWLNPPYASDLVGKFMEKLASSVEAGSVTEALVLVNNATETKWFARLAGVSSFLCFPTGRVKFWHPRKESMPLQGQCVAYIGNHGKRFCSEFGKFGIVVEIIR